MFGCDCHCIIVPSICINFFHLISRVWGVASLGSYMCRNNIIMFVKWVPKNAHALLVISVCLLEHQTLFYSLHKTQERMNRFCTVVFVGNLFTSASPCFTQLPRSPRYMHGFLDFWKKNIHKVIPVSI